MAVPYQELQKQHDSQRFKTDVFTSFLGTAADPGAQIRDARNAEPGNAAAAFEAVQEACMQVNNLADLAGDDV